MTTILENLGFHPCEADALTYAQENHFNTVDEAFDAWMAGARSGAKQLLSLISAPSGECGPRVWLHHGTNEGWESSNVYNSPRPHHVEFMRTTEHLATRAGDMQRIAELEFDCLESENSLMLRITEVGDFRVAITAEREKTTKLRASLTRLGTAISMGGSEEIKKAALAASQVLKETE